MCHEFDEEKATHAAAFLTAKFGGQVNYMKLLKLLYLADRDAFKKWGRPIVGGPYVGMDNGPLSSPAYDAVKASSGGSGFPLWTSVFRKEGYDLQMLRKIECDALSDVETELLCGILDRFGAMDQWQLVLYTHQNCEEWVDPQGSRLFIKEREILERVGLSTEQIETCEKDAKRFKVISQLKQ